MKRNKSAKIFLAIIIVFVAIALIFTVSNAIKINNMKENKKIDNVCEVPEGYTEESWNEHMSHHPDRYKQCLEQKTKH